MSEISTELFLITGFLGSGKTTFLRKGLEGLEQSKTAVICNEQNQFRVSASGFSDQAGMGSSFLQSIDNLLACRYEYILAETFGLAQPMILNQLVNDAEKRSRGKLRFRGMICVIDTLRFLKLFSSVVSMYEQAAYADCFVLSKADLAESGHIQEIKNIIKVIRPTAPVFICEKTFIPFKTMLAAIRGASMPEASVSWEHLEAFLNQMPSQPVSP